MSQFTIEAKRQLELLVAERGQLEAQLRRLDSQITALRSYVALDSGEFAVDVAVPVPSLLRRQSVKDKVVEIARSLLADGKTMHTVDLVVQLEAAGVDIGGADKRLTVSSILSRDAGFQANRKVGWSLRKNESLAANEASDSSPAELFKD